MIDLDELLAACGGRLLAGAMAGDGPAARTFPAFAYDSRIVAPGELFVAMITPTGDGHDYIAEAIRAGAAGVLCSRPPALPASGVAVIHVADVQEALNAYARAVLRRREVEVIGVTGSMGKTSAKEAIAAVLATGGPVFRSQGNYNGRFGLPIALGRLEPGQRLAVLEMAADSRGEIAHLAALARPRVGVVTAVAPAHGQYLGTLDEIAAEKGALPAALPAEGTAVLNADDPRVRAMAARTAAQVITYGLAADADYRGEDVAVTPQGTQVTACHAGERVRLSIPLIGAHHALTMLAAAAVGRRYGLTWAQIVAGLAAVDPLPGRTRLLAGMNGSQLLDDSYNANPASTLAALDTLAALPAARRLVLLGDMAELGAGAAEGHAIVGRRIAGVADVLVTRGELARLAAEEAARAGMPAAAIHVTYRPEDAVAALAAELRPGDLALIKGSAEARLETVSARLLRHPDQAAAVLPRQHSGWRQVRLERPGRPTWLEIDLDAVAHNVRRLAAGVGPQVQVMAVLKADAYGHGAVKVARTALNNGAAWLGVACLGEALDLRQAGISAPILALGYTPAWQAREALLHDVAVTLFTPEVAAALSQAAQDVGRTARAHVKVDTGMGRLGLLPEQTLAFMRAVAPLPGLTCEGIFTHLAAADDADPAYTAWQLDRFDAVLAELAAAGLRPPLAHAANSAATLRFPRSHYQLVRPGIALFGLNPSAETPCPADFRPALSFKCQVAQVKELPAGSDIGYGRTYRTPAPARIAVIPVGYADGFRRGPQHWGQVLVRGRRAPIIGRVCMDQTMIDVTGIPGVRQGDEVVLIGAQGNERLTVDEVAARLGTVNYEVVSEILARVPRMV